MREKTAAAHVHFDVAAGAAVSPANCALSVTDPETNAGGVDRIPPMVVATGTTNITDRPRHATTYRMLAEWPRSAASMIDVRARTAAPCQMNCSSAQPTDWTRLSFMSSTTALLLLNVGIDDLLKFLQLFGR